MRYLYCWGEAPRMRAALTRTMTKKTSDRKKKKRGPPLSSFWLCGCALPTGRGEWREEDFQKGNNINQKVCGHLSRLSLGVLPFAQALSTSSLTWTARDPPPAPFHAQDTMSAATAPTIKVQEVANPGLHRFRAIEGLHKHSSLKADVEKLAAQVAALEKKISAQGAEDGGAAVAAATAEPTIAELMASLKALTAAATADEAPVSSRAIGAGVVGARPSSAPYRTLRGGDSASVASWSADAFGKSKNPGWYHQCRKQLYAQRAARSAAQPKGCFISHSKYADEAVRIAATGRLAFSSGKTSGK
jgi:hypothetical protein